MRRISSYVNRLWATDAALTSLLVFLLVYFFLFPMAQFVPVKLLARLFFSLILMAGAMAATHNPIFRMLVLTWSLLAFALLWVRHLFPYQILALVNSGLSMTSLLLLTFLILLRAFREGPTTHHRITGAVAVYLLLGLLWALAYRLVSLLIPDAFNVQYPLALEDAESLPPHLFYFSFITLTTLGYGDIVPIHPIARMLVILEGITGQLFPAILIAWLVSVHAQSKREA